MKYVKHFTWKEWKKFNKPVKPNKRFDKFKSYDNLDKRHELLKGINAFCTDINCSTADTSKGNTICGNCEKYDEINRKYPPSRNLQPFTLLTMQEVLLSRYVIILDEYEPKWARRYTTIKKHINQKNFDKGLKNFNGMVNAFSTGLGETNTTKRKGKKASKGGSIWGDKRSKNTIGLWGKKQPSIWGDAPKKTRRKYKPRKKSNTLNIWNDDNKTSIW